MLSSYSQYSKFHLYIMEQNKETAIISTIINNKNLGDNSNSISTAKKFSDKLSNHNYNVVNEEFNVSNNLNVASTFENDKVYFVITAGKSNL